MHFQGGKWIKTSTGFKYQLREKLQMEIDIILHFWEKSNVKKEHRGLKKQDDTQKYARRNEHKDKSCCALLTWWAYTINSRLKNEVWELYHHWNTILNWNKIPDMSLGRKHAAVLRWTIFLSLEYCWVLMYILLVTKVIKSLVK